MLDGLLHPHSSIPYVQMGRSIVLYTVSLLSRDSCERVLLASSCCCDRLLPDSLPFLCLKFLFGSLPRSASLAWRLWSLSFELGYLIFLNASLGTLVV